MSLRLVIIKTKTVAFKEAYGKIDDYLSSSKQGLYSVLFSQISSLSDVLVL